jgi:hypothetical protein
MGSVRFNPRPERHNGRPFRQKVGHPWTATASPELTGAMDIGGSVDDPAGISSWDPSTELDLVAGTEYWITLVPTNSDIAWNYNKVVSSETRSSYPAAGSPPTTRSEPLRSLAEPEPGTAFLFGPGVLAVIGLKRR